MPGSVVGVNVIPGFVVGVGVIPGLAVGVKVVIGTLVGKVVLVVEGADELGKEIVEVKDSGGSDI